MAEIQTLAIGRRAFLVGAAVILPSSAAHPYATGLLSAKGQVDREAQARREYCRANPGECEFSMVEIGRYGKGALAVAGLAAILFGFWRLVK